MPPRRTGSWRASSSPAAALPEATGVDVVADDMDRSPEDSSALDATVPASTAVDEPAVVESAVPEAPGGVITRRAAAQPFEVHLDVFSGPFDLLLGLIAKHRLDLTEIALAKVTDEFIAHIRGQQAAQADWDLSQASEFVLVAATLLDLKAARLLPSLDPDEEDLELIEARDLLFARLLQYRAYKDVAAWCEQRMETAGRITARQAELEPQFAALLPELVMGITPEQLAMIAADALTRTPPQVGLEHLHQPLVSVREQAQLVVSRLRAQRRLTFRELVSDADSTLVIVARFLALLNLFREAAVQFEQPEALEELTVEWTGTDSGAVTVGADFDEDQMTDAPAPQAGTTAAEPAPEQEQQ